MKSLLPLMALLAAPLAARAQEAWSCIPGVKTPVRVNHGNVECAAKNGHDCLWGACSGKDAAPVPWSDDKSQATQPLACGADHKSKFGMDGYSSKSHWCSKACDALDGCAAVFVCEPGVGTPVRLHEGDVQCASFNGKDCLWGGCNNQPAHSKWQPPGGGAQLMPLTCGGEHKAKHGTDGYSTANHWCRKACDVFSCGKTSAEVPPLPTLPAPKGQ